LYPQLEETYAMKRTTVFVSLLAAAGLLLAACGPAATTEAPPAATEAPAEATEAPPATNDLLGAIRERGTLVVSTDPNYEPQSFLNTEGQRPGDTKCAADQLTTAEMQGFDVDVAIEIGNRLGVETCFATPSWDLITAGSWADKWDISVGSMTITTERQQALDFTTPYYYTPAVIAAKADAGIDALDDLAGQAVCAGTATTYETWLMGGDLGLPETSIYAEPPADVTVVSLETDQECAQAIAAGRTDFLAYSTSETVVDANIAAGMPVVKVGDPVFSEDLSVAIDKGHSLPAATLLAEVDAIVQAMHADGTLSQLSTKWFGADLTQAPNP
jgi:polar amino acid transport system substrate-binding protein